MTACALAGRPPAVSLYACYLHRKLRSVWRITAGNRDIDNDVNRGATLDSTFPL